MAHSCATSRSFLITFGTVDNPDKGIERVALRLGGRFARSFFSIANRLHLRFYVIVSATSYIYWVPGPPFECLQCGPVILFMRP
ncbi:MAG: hypothetical protein WAN08_10610 [Candidatus Sulfotelmatobacter sp.]